MGNVLIKEMSDNIRYTEFENNQVLTADQLNDLFRYLDIQSRLTRTRGIGVGIICGLEIGLTDQNKIMISMGSAITTDGDLLHFNSDQAFDSFIKFEDSNSKYDYFHNDQQVQIPLFQLVNSENSRTTGKKLEAFETEAGAPLKDFTGILYLEDYNKDVDLCTGEDCDNKGIECVKELKVLLVHNDQVAVLLKSIPVQNKNYFSLEDTDVPRMLLKKTIKKYDDLKGAFTTALNTKETLAVLLEKAYAVCKPVVEDELNSTDPVNTWKELLKKQFENQNPVYIEYLYDYLKDLCYAYNELKESLFNDDSICCPPVELFPKHIMLGGVKTATVRKPFISLAVAGALIPSHLLINLRRTIRFDIAADTIRRFRPVSVENEFRHSFYESPILRNKEEQTERILFCFKRIDAMIRNFKVPAAVDDIKKASDLRIIPSYSEDHQLGDRSIPFYYEYNPSLPINAYWSFDNNVRRKENGIKYFFSARYGLQKDFLLMNLLPFSFYRIEGHIGFKYQEVERVLNSIIDEYNLPINIVTLQVEEELEKIPVRPWHFPELHLYEHFVRQSFIDHLDQVEPVHNGINESLDEKIRTSSQPDEVEHFKIKKSIIADSVVNFTAAKTAVLNHRSVTNSNADQLAKFKTDVAQLINTTTDIKRQTKDFAFSNTAIPHDFIINTDILRKSDLLADLLDQKIKKKKESLILSNYLKLNPGLEHAGGVVTGGTFAIVYTASDDRVVADFMLPYANIDKEIVVDPPKPTPIPPIKVPPRFNPKIIEIEPTYIKVLDTRMGGIKNKLEIFESRVTGFDSNLKGFNSRFEGLDTKVTGVDFKVAGIRTLPVGTGAVTPVSPGATFDFDSKFLEFTNKFKDHETKFGKLDTDLGSMNDKLNNHDVRFGEFNNQLTTHVTKLGEVGNKVQGIETRIGTNDTKVSEFSVKLNGIENLVNLSEGKVNDINNRVGVLDSKVTANDSKMNNITGLVGNLDTKVNSHGTSLNDLGSKMGSIQNKVNDQDNKFTDLNSRVSSIGRTGPSPLVITPVRPHP